MKKRLVQELRFLTENSSCICLWMVLAAFGGCLIWVHGSMASWVFRSCRMPAGTPSFTVFFLLWLLLYCLHGAGVGISILIPCRNYKIQLRCLAVSLLSYLLTLAWYPLFFSVLHSMMAFLVLFAACILQSAACLSLVRNCRIILLLYFLTSLLEMYFLYVTIAFGLAN